MNHNRTLALLLTGIAVLQVMGLIRTYGIEHQIDNLRSQQTATLQTMQTELSSMEARLSHMADEQQWAVVRQTEVTPDDTCQAAEARVEWELRQWVPGTTTRLLYRTSADATWQEADVTELGGPNYAGSFLVEGPPNFDVSVSWSGSRVHENVEKPRAAATPHRDEANFQRPVEYQIVAEGPEFSRSTGAQVLPLYGNSIPVRVHVSSDTDGRYWVRLLTDKEGNRCTTVDRAEVRAYSENRLIRTVPMKEENPVGFKAEWKDSKHPDRLKVVIRSGEREEVIPVDF